MPTKTNTHNTTSALKKGGNFTKDLANLSVPFGLILAQKSLEKYLKTPSGSNASARSNTTKNFKSSDIKKTTKAKPTNKLTNKRKSIV